MLFARLVKKLGVMSCNQWCPVKIMKGTEQVLMLSWSNGR